MHFLLGAMAWVLAIALKRALSPASQKITHNILAQSGLRGAISAMSELGIAAAIFVAPLSWSLSKIYMFGVGAAAAEFALLMQWRQHRRKAAKSWSEPLRFRAQFGVERLCASLVHIGTRGLSFLAVSDHNLVAAAIALGSFALVDGVAAFGKLRGWSWTVPRTAYTYYLFVAAIGAATVVIFQVTYFTGPRA